tara:strand:+ start:394 stop:3258 length:2865 start_codon:yes stop_codon:yes gene_type:complete
MTSTEIVYIDCNRQNSVNSAQLNSEWEYKIGNEGLVCPAGTQVMVQDTFINKRGISANSIEIVADIDERVDCSFYFNYDPKWQPKGEGNSDPDVADYEGIYADTLNELGQQQTDYGKFARQPGRKGMAVNPVASVRGRATNFIDPRVNGFPNTPLPLLKTAMADGSAINEEAGLIENWTQAILEPETRSIRVFVPKGVYGLSELAELVEDQMTGRLVNVANGDFNKDYIQERNEANIQPRPLVMNDNDRLCIAKRSFKDQGVDEDYNFSNAFQDTVIIVNSSTAVPVGRLLGSVASPGQPLVDNLPATDSQIRYIYLQVENQFSMPFTPTAGQPAPPNPPVNGAGIPATNGAIYLNGEYITYGSFTYPPAEPVYPGTDFIIRLNNCRRGMLNGSTAVVPSKYDLNFFNTPYQRLDASPAKFHNNYNTDNEERGILVANGTRNKGFGQNALGAPLNFRIPNTDRGIFTVSESFNEMVADYKAPLVAGDTRLGRYYYSNQLMTEGVDVNTLQKTFNHDQPYASVDYMGLFYIDDFSLTNGIDGKNFNYNPTRRGYYIGAPEFNVEWNTEKSAYSIRNLHQPFRINSHDQYANPIEGEGEIAVEFKRFAKITQTGTATTNDTFVHPDFRRGMENSQDRYGGVSVYNWARTAARKYADIDIFDPTNFNQNYLHLLTWDDHFSTRPKAKIAWNNTLWAQMGFTYEQLADTANYELPPHRYDVATTNTNFYGTTTRAKIDSSLNSSIATTYNPNDSEYFDIGAQPVRAYNHCDINTSYLGYTTDGTIPVSAQQPNEPIPDPANPPNLDGIVDTSKCFFSSNYQNQTTALITTSDRPLTATGLPRLNTQGYLIVSSDIIDTHEDSIKNSQNLPMIGVVPLGTFSSQDFITSENQMVHILGQQKIINSIKIKIYNPDLTPADLDSFSSVILKIVRPVQLPQQIAPPSEEMKRNKETTKKNRN